MVDTLCSSLDSFISENEDNCPVCKSRLVMESFTQEKLQAIRLGDVNTDTTLRSFVSTEYSVLTGYSVKPIFTLPRCLGSAPQARGKHACGYYGSASPKVPPPWRCEQESQAISEPGFTNSNC